MIRTVRKLMTHIVRRAQTELYLKTHERLRQFVSLWHICQKNQNVYYHRIHHERKVFFILDSNRIQRTVWHHRHFSLCIISVYTSVNLGILSVGAIFALLLNILKPSISNVKIQKWTKRINAIHASNVTNIGHDLTSRDPNSCNKTSSPDRYLFAVPVTKNLCEWKIW